MVSRQLWTRFDDWLTDSLPQPLENALRSGHRYLMPLMQLRVPLFLLKGLTGLSPTSTGTVLVAGQGVTIEVLARRFFEGEPECEAIGSVSLFTLPCAFARWRNKADLVIARVPRSVAGPMSRGRYLRLPEAVGGRLAVPSDPDDLSDISRSVRSNVQSVLRNALTWTVSHRTEDFEFFYREIYLPFAKGRFGDLAFLRNRHSLRRQFRQGGILWIEHCGMRIAGVLFQTDGSTLRLVSLGALDDRGEARALGALSAIYLFSAAYAREKGLDWVDFGTSLPLLNDSGLMHKRSWGTILTERRESRHDLLLGWGRCGEELIRFLAATPMVIRHGRTFAALGAPGSGTPNDRSLDLLGRKFLMPGLRRLYVVSLGGARPQDGATERSAPPRVVTVGAGASNRVVDEIDRLGRNFERI